MTVKVDRDGCISCGLCADVCPNVFRMADDGLSEVYKQPDEADKECASEAAASCPVSVISIE